MVNVLMPRSMLKLFDNSVNIELIHSIIALHEILSQLYFLAVRFSRTVAFKLVIKNMNNQQILL